MIAFMQEAVLTKKDLEEVLDAKFGQYQAVIIEAVDWKFQRMEEKFDGKFQGMEQKFEYRFQNLEQRMDRVDEKLDRLTTTLDNFLHRLDKWEQEFTLLKADVDKIKMILKEKLGVEVAIQG